MSNMTPNTSSSEPINPNQHLNIPAWVNEDYFRPIIEKDEPNFVSIRNFTPIAATSPGDNYTSTMIRVIVRIELKDGSEKDTSYILKTMLESTETASFVNSMQLFPKEKQMYEVHIPNFTKLYNEAGVDIELAPRCLHIEETPECITLVMEDLKRRNFSNADRLKGLDMAHMSRVLQKLAELHAASAVNYELNGKYENMYLLSFYTEDNRKMFEAMGEARHAQYAKAMRQWGLPDVETHINITSDAKFFDAAVKLNEVNENEFNVLNHGDCWVNNIMFSYKDNGEIDRTLFVDLQVGKYGTPAQDLWYLITTSAALDIKITQFDHFVAIYHQRLIECLKLLNYPNSLPTLREMHIMMIKYGFWGPLTSFGVLIAVLFPSDKDSTMENMMAQGPEADAFRYKTFINPYYAKAMVQLFPFFTNRGCFVMD
ncbi:uncharacterized protein LOC115623973 [Scaptodrosophila lebanonensis]|uniref:Uncharacterized protein LOC115623973 n=1 Tax=Drosophila lebanonensis TaxID=7225 RepID=A0A6J2TH98_DROLE|nr:uncharacterized protein LOC115623973 [Scaptodrosophila lebanonensis]